MSRTKLPEMEKSATDRHWNERPKQVADKRLVNIGDLAQRALEDDFLLPRLGATDRVLEVGCGNGFLTDVIRQRVEFVDAFDYAENMVAQALEAYGEKNNRFFLDNVLAPESVTPPYDTIVCVRVLINLRDTDEQLRAIRNLHALLKPGGKLLLLEGFLDGFEALNKVRTDSGLEALRPASINHYSKFDDVWPTIDELFTVEATGHTGMFDFLTRVIYPALVGAANATGYSEFHQKVLSVARVFNPEDLKPLSRLRNFSLIAK